MEWTPFDYDDKAATAPPARLFVWIYDADYDGVTLGYFDGYTMRNVRGSDDCHVTHWRHLDRPAPPPGADDNEGQADEATD